MATEAFWLAVTSLLFCGCPISELGSKFKSEVVALSREGSLRAVKIIAACAFFLWIATPSYGDSSSPPDFNQETPMTKLSTPVDFSALVCAEASKTVSVSFWTQFDKQSKDTQRQLGLVTVQPRELEKTAYKLLVDAVKEL